MLWWLTLPLKIGKGRYPSLNHSIHNMQKLGMDMTEDGCNGSSFALPLIGISGLHYWNWKLHWNTGIKYFLGSCYNGFYSSLGNSSILVHRFQTAPLILFLVSQESLQVFLWTVRQYPVNTSLLPIKLPWPQRQHFVLLYRSRLSSISTV